GPVPQVVRQAVIGSECQLTLPLDEERTLIFSNNGLEKREKVRWRSEVEYRIWLKDTLPVELAMLDPNYDRAGWNRIVERIVGRIQPNKYDYPVAVKAVR